VVVVIINKARKDIDTGTDNTGTVNIKYIIIINYKGCKSSG
jgi:hypothetical protein